MNSKRQLQFSFLHYLVFISLLLPLSCSAQKNILSEVSTATRSDQKGQVIRFHLTQDIRSFDFSQPSDYRLQLELHSGDIDTTDIKLTDPGSIINHIDYYDLRGGIGADIFLTKTHFYQVNAYPDAATPDMLLGLSKTNGPALAKKVSAQDPFKWSDTPVLGGASGAPASPEDQPIARDTTYEEIRRKTRFDTVVLDPGHGGHDTGAIGYHHTLEKDVVLSIAKKVGHYIKKYMPGVKVVYTRNSDKFIGLKERGRIANRANGDLFVCIHANSARARRAHGTETFFLGLERSKTALKVMERENNVVTTASAHPDKKVSKQQLMIYELANSGYINNSEKLAAMIQNQFRDRAGRKSRGIKQARFVVLYHASMPAVLVETGFITNPSEQKYMTSDYGQNIIASAIFRAIRNYGDEFNRGHHLETSRK